MKRIFSSFSANAVLLLFSLSCVFPVIWVFYNSFKTTREFGANIIGLPERLLLENYEAILAGGSIMGYMYNTTRNTVLALIGIVLFGFILGYFLARFKFRFRTPLFLLILFGMLMPIHSIIVPIYVIFVQFDLHNNWYTLLLPYIAFGLPLAVFIVDSYVRSIPRELEEAAAIDGATFSRCLFMIMMPVCAPVLIAVGIIQAFSTWNEFIFALLLVSDEIHVTLPVGLSRFFRGQFAAHYPRMMAAMIVSILPPMVFYFSFSKRIIEGMVAGSVKG